MKKNLTTTFLLSLVFNFVFAQNIYIRFNSVPAASGILQGTIGVPVSFEEEVATDAYLMDVPAEDEEMYTKSLLLPAGNYQYQAVYADGTGLFGRQAEGRSFSLSEEKTIVFRAKIDSDNTIKFLCDAQRLYHSNTTSTSGAILLPDADDNGNVRYTFTYPNYKGKVEAIIYPEGNTTQYTCDLFARIGKTDFNLANGKVKWLVVYNRHTFAFVEKKKLVTLLDNDSISIGSEKMQASQLSADLGSFSTSVPLLVSGKTTSVSARIGVDELGGAEKADALLKIAPADIQAKMYYEIISGSDILVSESETLSTSSDSDTPENETTWTLNEAININTGLDDGTYMLNIWYATVCYGDTINSNVYSTTFSVDNGPETSVQETESAIKYFVQDRTIYLNLEQAADVKLFSVTGQLIDRSVATEKYVQTVNQSGMYILSINGKTLKVVVK